MQLSRWTAGLLATVAMGAANAAGEIWTETFEAFPNGWTLTNLSSGADVPWFSGSVDAFSAQAGSAGSYAAASYQSSYLEDGVISNWLISPLIADLEAGQTLTFWTRRDFALGYPADTLFVRLSTGSAATGDFTTLLGGIGLEATGTQYPNNWKRYSFVIPDVAGLAGGRIAFQYAVADAIGSNYIGIDSIALVPEPSTYALLGLGLAGVLLRRRLAAA